MRLDLTSDEVDLLAYLAEGCDDMDGGDNSQRAGGEQNAAHNKAVAMRVARYLRRRLRQERERAMP